MPISKAEFEDAKVQLNVEEAIKNFLIKRKDRAFTAREIMQGTSYPTEFTTPEHIKVSTFAVADFTSFLHDLAAKREILMRTIRGQMYFKAAEWRGKCKKCSFESFKPRKTWKMAGRPDRKGMRLQLLIGLYDCPKHGVFRVALEKTKIPDTGSTQRKKKAAKTGKKRVRTKLNK